MFSHLVSHVDEIGAICANGLRQGDGFTQGKMRNVRLDAKSVNHKCFAAFGSLIPNNSTFSVRVKIFRHQEFTIYTVINFYIVNKTGTFEDNAYFFQPAD